MIAALLLLTGCRGAGGRIRLGSPTFQHAPELTCIVVLTGDRVDEALMRAALDTCKEAVDKSKPIP